VALENGSEISLPVLPDRIAGYSAIGTGSAHGDRVNIPLEGVNFEKEMADAERRYLRAALEKADGVRTRAAEMLKIAYRSFRHYSKKHNI